MKAVRARLKGQDTAAPSESQVSSLRDPPRLPEERPHSSRSEITRNIAASMTGLLLMQTGPVGFPLVGEQACSMSRRPSIGARAASVSPTSDDTSAGGSPIFP
jgi:hypothetical protein